MVTPLNKQITWIIYHLPAYKVLNANLVKRRREFVLNKGQILCERLMFWFLEDLLISSVISFFFSIPGYRMILLMHIIAMATLTTNWCILND